MDTQPELSFTSIEAKTSVKLSISSEVGIDLKKVFFNDNYLQDKDKIFFLFTNIIPNFFSFFSIF